MGEISEEEVVDNVVLLVFAAHDTTSFVVAIPAATRFSFKVRNVRESILLIT